MVIQNKKSTQVRNTNYANASKRHRRNSSKERYSTFSGQWDTAETTVRRSALATAYRHGRIVLIDGVRLTQLMLAHGVGVHAVRTFILYEIDEDFFENEIIC